MTNIVQHNTFEGGTDGAQVTVAGSGGASGDPFDGIIWNNASFDSGTPNILYSTAAALRGTKGFSMVVANTTNYIRDTLTSPGGRGVIRVGNTYPGAPATSTLIAQIRNTSQAVMGSLQITNTGKVRPLGATGAQPSGSDSSATVAGKINAGVLAPGKYFYDLAVIKGTDTTNGSIAWRLWDSDTGVLLDSWSGTGVNTGILDPFLARWLGPTAWASATYLGDETYFAGSDDSAYWLPAPSLPAPTINVTQPAPNLVDLRGSTAGDASSLTFPTPVHVSGPTLTVTSLTAGLWLFAQDTGAASVYTVSTKQSGDNQTTSQNVTIDPVASGVNKNAPLRPMSTPPNNVWG